MRTGFFPFVALAVLSACGWSKSDTPATSTGGSTLSYTPAGCGYTVTPPDSRGFTDMFLDGDDPAAPTPARVHIGLGGATKSGAAGYADASTSAAFTWETPSATKAAKLKIGTDPNKLDDVHTGYSWTTPDGNMFLHEVHVCGLEPDTTYYFQAGGGSAFSATRSFTTPPTDGSITIGVSGDSRDSTDVFAMVQARMKDAGVKLQLFSGDLVLIGNQPALYQPYVDAIVPTQMFLPVAGNHENESAQFYSLFALPGDGDYAETFASFDLGAAHVVMLDDQQIATKPSDAPAKAQLAWLDEDLGRAEANRAKHPFLVVVHHRGELSTSKHAGEADMIASRDALMPIWDKHHVDLVLDGHDHDYERTKPVTGPGSAPVVQTAPGAGTTYIVCAGAGAGGYAPGTSQVDYRAKNAGFGTGTPYVGVYSLLTIEASKLSFKAYGLKASGGSVAGDDVIDTVDITR